MTFLAQKLIYTIYIWFNFAFGSFYEQDHLGVYPKRLPKWPKFQHKNWCSPKSDWWFFFLPLTVRWPFHRKYFKWKEIRGYGLISEKMEALCAKLNERAEAATSSYSVKGDFLQYIYLVAVTKNLQNIQSRCFVHEFSFKDIFQQY